ncbi:hypothetical protein PIB30_093053, partial [Stylosanthes scabra]|nr:hypothetical protein [Stylosanthes scabra]
MEGKSFKTMKRKSVKENPSHRKSFTIDEEGGAEYDGRFFKVLHTIQMKLLTCEDMVMSVVKNQGQQIQTLTDVVAQYGEVLQTLMSSGFVEDHSSKKQETTNTVEGGSTKTALKRRLDFGVEDIAPNERFINIRQQELGSPFTVYAYTGMDMQSEDTPKCLDLVFWPPKGMTFAGFEFPVAAYVFSHGLDM